MNIKHKALHVYHSRMAKVYDKFSKSASDLQKYHSHMEKDRSGPQSSYGKQSIKGLMTNEEWSKKNAPYHREQSKAAGERSKVYREMSTHHSLEAKKYE